MLMSRWKRVNSFPLVPHFAPMLREDIQLRSPDFDTKTETKSGVISITLSQETGEAAGSLTLEFSESPFALRRWIILDAVEVETKMTLQNLQFGDRFNNFLFAILIPHHQVTKIRTPTSIYLRVLS